MSVFNEEFRLKFYWSQRFGNCAKMLYTYIFAGNFQNFVIEFVLSKTSGEIV